MCSPKGISYVEILVAVGLLSAIMLPVMFVFGAGTRGIQITEEELISHGAGAELIEQLMSAPFNFLPEGTFANDQIQNGKFISPKYPLRFHISDTPNIQRELKITDLKKDGKIRFKKFEVNITFMGSGGKPANKVTLKSLFANETD